MHQIFNERVTLTFVDHVANVMLSRPSHHNGLDWAMIDGLLEVQQCLTQLVGLRAVVLGGDGDSFCAGLDMASIMGEAERLPTLLAPDATGVNPVQRLALGWREAGVPVVAALHGHVYGGGLQIALGADIRILHPQARLGLLEIDWGIIPDMAISVTGEGLRQDVLHEMAITGRKVSGEEAYQLGLGSRLSDTPQESAWETAALIATRSPRAVAAARELFTRGLSLAHRDRLALEANLQQQLLAGNEHREAVSARMERRATRFD